jgi:lipid-binding SYLF domain-containing protein
MSRLRAPCGASLVVLALAAVPVRAVGWEMATVESAAEVVQSLAKVPLRGIPPALLKDAKGVAVIPNVLKAGLLVDGRFGRGVLLVRQADGSWSNPTLITLSGGGFGLQIGVQSTDLVLVFKTARGVEQVLKKGGNVTLGGDLSVAAGPVGREAEAATDVQLKAEIYSYSRSRGLFAGVALQGSHLRVDAFATDTFYRMPNAPVAVETLKDALYRLSGPPAPGPALIFPPQPMPVPQPAPLPQAPVPVPTPPPG